MIEIILGNKTAGRVLFYLLRRGESYPTEVAGELSIPLNMVQKQFARFEKGGFLTSSHRGRLRYYRLNTNHPLFRELKKILEVGVQSADPADGSYLTLKERIIEGARLLREGEKLVRRKRYQPFVRSFGDFRKYESWRKKQKNPWLA